MPERTDHNEAMRLAQALKNRQEVEDDAADMLMQQAERIAELESRVHTCGPTCSKAGCINRRITAERDRLLAEVERLRADGERMDWLEKHASDVHAIHDKDGHIQSFQFDCDEGGSLRSALDAARTTHKETE